MRAQPIVDAADTALSDRQSSDSQDEALFLAQLMCSRLCHDLVGPLGGVSAGLELLADSGDAAVSDAAREALDLLTMSAAQANQRASFFRQAFGLGGGVASTVPIADVKGAAEGFLADGSVVLAWSDDDMDPSDRVAVLPGNAAKLLLVMVMLGAGALVRGGQVTCHVVALPEGLGLAVTASGTGAALKPDVTEALRSDAPGDWLTARTVHAHLARRLANAAGGVLEIETAEDDVRLAALVSAQAGAPRPAP